MLPTHAKLGRMGKLDWVLGLFVCCVASACGGTSDSAKCGQGSACGGNLVGSWKIRSSCVTSDAIMTSAGVLTQTPSNGTASTTDYCVNGSTLTLSSHQDSSMPGTTGIRGTIVLSKE